MRMKINKEAPCQEKWCSFCCNPVWITWRYTPDISRITDATWKKIRKYIGIRPSKKHPDTEKIRLYECSLFDTATGLCKEYDKRPNICRNTSCINPMSNKSIDEQHEEFTDI